MKKWKTGFRGLLLAMMLLLLQTGCAAVPEGALAGSAPVTLDAVVVPVVSEAESTEAGIESVDAESTEAGAENVAGESTEVESESADAELPDWLPEEGEYYYDLENVVLYLYLYEELPDNYITKSEARALGWEGGSVEKYLKGAAIGGDTFGNREGLLPEEDGRDYTECDLDTDGGKSRGAKRLVFSDDGLYFYTEDHYESFEEVMITEEFEVVW